MMEKLLIFLLFIKIASSQMDIAVMDARMTQNRQDLINRELSISYLFGNLSQLITNCTDNLTAQFLSRDLILELNNTNNIVKLQMTLKDFEAYNNISTCGDINYKMITIEFDQNYLLQVALQASRNISIFAAAYSRAFSCAGQIYFSSNSDYQTVVSIVRQSIAIVQAIQQLIGQIYRQHGNLASFNNQLLVFR